MNAPKWCDGCGEPVQVCRCGEIDVVIGKPNGGRSVYVACAQRQMVQVWPFAAFLEAYRAEVRYMAGPLHGIEAETSQPTLGFRVSGLRKRRKPMLGRTARDATPLAFATWLLEVARRCGGAS